MPRQEAGEPYYRVTLDEVMKLYDADDTVVVDVRRPNEYESGHVKGALHVPVDDVLARIGELPEDKRLLFICAAGVRSGLACEMASAMGLDNENLFNIEDGTGPWIERGFPTSYGDDA